MPPRKKTQTAKPVTCQECALGVSTYIPCGRPAVVMIGWKGRSETPLPMCEMCADHNVRNRSGYIVEAKLKAVSFPLVVEDPPPAGHNNPPPDPPSPDGSDAASRPTESDEQLIAENFKLEDLIKAATAKLNEWAAPHKARIKAIEDELFRRLAERQANSTPTDAGTAYISNIVNFPIADRMQILDFMLDNWDQPDWGGGQMMTFGITKDAVKQYMDAHNGQLPPGLSITHFSRLNIKRS